MPLEAFTLKKTKVQQRIDALAILRSENFVDIKAHKGNMRIKEILYEEGTWVKKDQPLIQFDDMEASLRFHLFFGRVHKRF